MRVITIRVEDTREYGDASASEVEAMVLQMIEDGTYFGPRAEVASVEARDLAITPPGDRAPLPVFACSP